MGNLDAHARTHTHTHEQAHAPKTGAEKDAGGEEEPPPPKRPRKEESFDRFLRTNPFLDGSGFAKLIAEYTTFCRIQNIPETKRVALERDNDGMPLSDTEQFLAERGIEVVHNEIPHSARSTVRRTKVRPVPHSNTSGGWEIEGVTIGPAQQ